MNSLHITSHNGTIANMENVYKYLNKSILITESSKHGINFINKEESDFLYLHYHNRLNEFKFIIFTDTSMIARPFLENIDSHNCILVIYITNRFDWGMWNVSKKDHTEYCELYSKLSNHKRVIFCADNNFDQFYAKKYNIHFLFYEKITLTPSICEKEIINYSMNKFFIYNRGTKIDHYFKILDELNISYDIFGESYERYKDREQICQYKGFLHLPYQTNIQSLWENLGYFIIYFIPSKKFITELILNTSWYYWEERNREFDLLIKSIELSEWYNKENEIVFEYFDNWLELKNKFQNLSDDYLFKKKRDIKNFIENSNSINIKKWEIILNK